MPTPSKIAESSPGSPRHSLKFREYTATTTLRVREKIGYALGDVASNFYWSFFGLFLIYYYTDVVGLAPAAVGTMMLVTRLFDAFTDLAMGAIADRTRTRWGRFRPWILWGAIPYGVCGMAMFLVPDWGDTGKLLYAYLTYSLMMLMYTVVNVPYSALMGVMSPNSQERTSLSAYRFFGAFGAGMLISYAALPLKNWLGGGDDRLGFLWTMGLFSLLSIGCFFIAFASTRERVEPTREAPTSFKRDIGLVLRNRAWLILFIIGIIALTAAGVRNGSILYYFKYNIGDESAARWFMTGGMIATILTTSLAPWTVRHWGKRNTLMGATLLMSLLWAVAYLIPTDRIALVLGTHFLACLLSGPSAAIMWSMYADTADQIEVTSGRRITGMVYSGVLFAIKMGIALGGAVIGWLLAAFNFVPNATPTPESLHGILLVFSVIPAGFSIINVVLLYFYPLTENRVKANEAALAVRHAQSA